MPAERAFDAFYGKLLLLRHALSSLPFPTLSVKMLDLQTGHTLSQASMTLQRSKQRAVGELSLQFLCIRTCSPACLITLRRVFGGSAAGLTISDNCQIAHDERCLDSSG